MTENKLTLIDAFNQFWTAVDNTGDHSIIHAGLTYFYLIKIWNAAGRPNYFYRQNNQICAQLNISRPTLDRHRKALQQSGLIVYSSSGKGSSSISYTLMHWMPHKMECEKENKITSIVSNNIKMEHFEADNITSSVTTNLKMEHLKAFNITSSNTSPITSDDTYKQSKSTEKEKEILVVVSGEKKSFNFFKNYFFSDAGIVGGFLKLGLPRGNFEDALELWLIRNHGKEYPGIQEARKHFLFWLPFYQTHKEKNHETKPSFTNSKNNQSRRKTDLDYAEGL